MTTSVGCRKWSSVLLMSIAVALACAAPVSAQFETAVVLGSVRDSSGAAVPGATITLTNTDTGIASVTHADENGNYQFVNVRIGTYQVAAELSGFSGALARDVVVAVNARRRIDLTLQVGTP